jgi:dipeptidyl aminopeptidase/acylaminoacyl peptidase
MKQLLLALLAALVATGFTPPVAAQGASAGLVPAEAFFRDDDVRGATLSPSGRYVAALLAPSSGRNGLFVFDLQAPGDWALVARFANVDLSSFQWLDEERLLFSVIDRHPGTAAVRVSPGLFLVARSGGAPPAMLISPTQGGRSGDLRSPNDHTVLDDRHVLLSVPRDPRSVVVGERRWNTNGELVAIVPRRLDLATRRLTELASDLPEDATCWHFDAEGQPRLACARRNGRLRVHWRGPDAKGWELIGDLDGTSPAWVPRFIGDDGTLHVTAPDAQGFSTLRRFDLQRRTPLAEAVIATPGFDFEGWPVHAPADRRVLGVRVRADADTTVWFDAPMRELQARLDRSFPGRINHISGCKPCEGADALVLVHAYSDRNPGEVLVYRPGSNKLSRIARVRRDIDPARMAAVDFKTFAARDGRAVPLWVTTPSGVAAERKPAVVVLVQGGPWVRNGYWRWDDMAQFLASRGYVVLEPEFRGSTGYGEPHHRAGWKQFGLAMQDDVADAVSWATRQGLIDGGRVCIAGISYGGYSTLMGLARHPELYRCGIAWAALTEPRLLFKSTWQHDLPEEFQRHELPRMLGDPDKDSALLDAASAVRQAGRMKAPLLLAHGEIDRRVPLEHGQAMRNALRDAGRPPEWVQYRHEGHGWTLLENRVDWAARMEKFLAQHLR